MTTSPLLSMAKYSVNRDKLMAHLIHFHVSENEMAWEEVATELNISLEQIAKLALCNRPRSNHYASDLTKIAQYVEMDTNELGKFVTRIETALTFKEKAQDQFLMAARDKDKKDRED